MNKQREFMMLGDRYTFDVECSSKRGFAQVDTAQDASYYGTWASPEELTVVSYCEGDVTRTFCDDHEEFAAEIRAIEKWNDEAGYGPIGIDPGWPGTESCERIAAAFKSLGLGDLLH